LPSLYTDADDNHGELLAVGSDPLAASPLAASPFGLLGAHGSVVLVTDAVHEIPQ
jgi:hypothetical protein